MFFKSTVDNLTVSYRKLFTTVPVHRYFITDPEIEELTTTPIAIETKKPKKKKKKPLVNPPDFDESADYCWY